jgi:hypothetical protein
MAYGRLISSRWIFLNAYLVVLLAHPDIDIHQNIMEIVYHTHHHLSYEESNTLLLYGIFFSMLALVLKLNKLITSIDVLLFFQWPTYRMFHVPFSSCSGQAIFC